LRNIIILRKFKMSGIDTNVDNYTIDELLMVIDLDADSATSATIMEETDAYIQKYTESGDEQMTTFFEDMQTKLLQYVNNLEQGEDTGDYSPDDSQTQNWYENQALPQEDTTQSDKTTDRKQQIDVYDNDHVPMNRNQLGVNNTIDTKVAQDSLNPNLENVTNRVIILDSQYRQLDSSTSSSSTDYTLNLSETLKNVISLRVYSVQIPISWYTIDTLFGNTCFWITNFDSFGVATNYLIEIESGNYTTDEFVTALNDAFLGPFYDPSGAPYSPGGFSISPLPVGITYPVSYNSKTGKITINLNGFDDPQGNPIAGAAAGSATDVSPYITFFDVNRRLHCKENCSSPGLCVDRTLGWMMGYTSPVVFISSSTNGNVANSILNLFGPKYFLLIVEDFNQNHINNGVVNISEMSTKLSMPNYYRPDLPYTCIPVGQKQIFKLLPSAPRTLTQAQMYTINEINKNRESDTNYRGKPPSSSDTLAVIPLKVSGMSIGDVYVEFGGTLQDNKRTYFGPVDIDRFHIKLLDDRGYVVNLNGSDWCVTLISENLYQY
jgi:hypothetical protein